MNADAVRAAAQNLTAQGDKVTEISRAVGSLLQVAHANWQGDDLRQFEQRWQQQYHGTCLQLGDQLREWANLARRNAETQERTSATLEGGSAAGPTASGSATAPPGWDLLGLYTGGLGLLDQANTLLQLDGVGWSDVADAKAGSPLLSTLLYLPEAFQAFGDAAAGDLTPEAQVAFSGKTFELGGTFLDRFGTSYFGEAMGKSMGMMGSGISAGLDFGNAKEAFDSGDVLGGVYDLAHGGVAVVGGAVPTVRLGLAAWDVGVATGTWIGNSPPAQEFQDELVAYGAAQDANIATRYDIGERGVEAVGNWAGDSLHSLFH